MGTFNIVAESSESTVMTEYIAKGKRSESYQSEAELENELIRMVIEQGYERLTITDEKSLIANLRVKIEQLNNYNFTDSEWKRFFNTNIANANERIVEKTRTIQDDCVKNLERDDGSTKNIHLIDKKNINNNRLQVLNQYEVSQENDGAKHDNRYDVTILVNGLPLVHIELKRRGVAIREAFNQINRYQRDSFWAGCGLYEYVQIFIISNGTHTKYYSNTTRDAHINEQEKNKRRGKKTSNSFEFTSYWADANNKVIPDLVDFTKTFLSKHTILNVLTKYCVFTAEDILLVMRPYQIAATERILNRIEISTNYKKLGTLDAGGYIWHTTGSGKTLTSFKTAQLASSIDDIEKVLFVVDRKDLDYQTMKEYDRFEKGAANSNTSTKILGDQLENDGAKIIITTIQKLDKFISKNKNHEVFNKHVVMVFDECHRSQFGDMHKKITKCFKKYHIFGFTGTPIFADNAGSGKSYDLRTTPQAFGDKLHTYTIVDAINDGNVLPFRIDYVSTIKEKSGIYDENVKAIDREKALMEPRRISEITKYILEHFDQKTKRNRESFGFSILTNVKEVASAKKRDEVEEKKQRIRMTGFNSIFAVSSIDAAKMYYTEFQKQMKDLPEAKKLRIATIYSYGVNEDVTDDFVEDENSENTDGLDQSSRDFLDMAIDDYNNMFKTNYDTSSDKFQNYYKDVSLRMKNREIDILIVVNMFLTGFDATTLNTLWVDKNLKYHGLIQAFSRTNRILNSVKTFGNIICFRNLEEETNKAIALFGDKSAGSIVLLKNFEAYYNGYDEDGKHYDGYVELIARLQQLFPLGQPITSEEAQKDFIKLYGAILRMKNILTSFDNFKGKEIISERDFQDYQSEYIDLYQQLKPKENEKKENINDDIVFEIELIKQVEINIDYILMLVKQYQKDGNKDKEILVSIDKAVNSSMNLRSKLQLIHDFIKTVTPHTEVDGEWRKFIEQQRENDLAEIINDEKLKNDETRKFIENSFRDGSLKTTGTDIDGILPPISRFGGGGNRAEKKKKVIEILSLYFEKYFELFYLK
ncbi:MAG: type I restriction endonuclease subunit R [Clostridium butyricum]|nr:type I restriction endonuclease subunit R [Clostridium butyricum]MDU4853201.1 type I restriction endonuclease subunit R [Clostridioides difficile]